MNVKAVFCWFKVTLWLCLFSILSASRAWAESAPPACTAVFPDGAQSNSNGGEIRLDWGARILGSPDNRLETRRLDDRSGGDSCGSVNCSKTNTVANPVDFNNFPNNNNDVDIGFNESRTLYPGDYDDIRLHSRARATLMPGEYRIRGALRIGDNAEIRLGGSDAVRLLVKNSARFDSNSTINPGGDASQLIVYARRDVDLYSSTEFTGFVYSKESVRLYNRATVIGAVSAKRLQLKSSSARINYQATAAANAQFGELCGGGSAPPPPPPAAGGCAAIWPDGVQSHDDKGEVRFDWGAKLLKSPDNIVDAVEIDDNSGGVSCSSTTCTASFSPSQKLDFDDFRSGGSKIEVAYKGQLTLPPGTYKEIELKGQSRLILQAGDYYVSDKVKLKWDSEIRLPSSGVVRMFVDKFESDGRGDINAGGQPEQLLIVAEDDVKFKHTDNVQAFVYSQEKVELGHGSFLKGAISGKEVRLKSSNPRVEFDQAALERADFGGICAGGAQPLPEPIAEYRFDECTVESVLKDEKETYDAQPRNADTVDVSVIGNALDLSADGTQDYVSLPRTLVHGLNDFSIALWIKTPVSKSQQEIMQALGSNADDDELEIYLINNRRIRMQVQDDDVNLDSNKTLTDNQWHHLLITRQGNKGCLYVDGELQECETGLGSSALSVTRNAFILGQEQDSYGGSFSSTQSYEGLMDELKFYDKTLSAQNAKNLHDNEKAKKNQDGTARPAPDCNGVEICETYRDNFSQVRVDNNDGTLNWLANWREYDRDGNGLHRGDIFINGSGRLSITGKNNYTNNNWIERRFNAAGYDKATLNLNYRTSSSVDRDDKLIVEASTDGGNTYTTIHTFSNMDRSTTKDFSTSLNEVRAADTRLRFRVYPDNGRDDCCFGSDQETIEFDYVEVKVCKNGKPEAAADLRFDELKWNGSPDEAEDSSEKSLYDGRAINGASTLKEGQVCRAAEFDGVDDYLQIDNFSEILKGTATLSFWLKTTQRGSNSAWNAPAVAGIEERGGTDDIFWGWLDSSGRIGISVGNDGSSKSTRAVNDDQWHHIVLTRDASDGKYQIFIDGALNKEGTSTAGVIGNSFSSLGRLETTPSSTARYYQGLLDELVVFPMVLNAGHVATIFDNQSNDKRWDGSDAVCLLGDQVDHYGISVAATPALTCETGEITITAYDDKGDPVKPAAGTKITLTTSQTIDGWTIKDGDKNVLPGNPYTFDGNRSSITLNMLRTTPTTSAININLIDGDDITELRTDADKDQTIEFADAAFRFSAIAPQIAGKASESITLSAIQTDADTGRCVALKTTDNVNIGFAYSCTDPATCSNNSGLADIDSTTIHAGTLGTTGSLPKADKFTAVSLKFNENGIADFTNTFRDAGKIKLLAAAEVSIPGTSKKAWIKGSSNEYVVKPAGLCLKATDTKASCAAKNATCSAFTAAGKNFAMEISGRLWQKDKDADFCDNAVTPNFQLNDIDLTLKLLAPLTNVTPAMTTAKVSITKDGKHPFDQSINEVGVFEITAKPPKYHGQTISNATTVLGRFYPDHFTLDSKSLTNRSDLTCNPDSTFTYLSENFSASATLTARNVAGDITQNYVGGFDKLTNRSQLNMKLVNIPGTGSKTDYRNNTRQKLPTGTLNWPEINHADAGKLTIPSTLMLERNSTHEAPITDLHVAIAPDDGDTTLNSFDLDLDADAGNQDDHASLGKTELRFGRMQILSTVGPETEPLTLPLEIQYYDGSEYQLNTDDSCTPIDNSKIQLSVVDDDSDAQSANMSTGVLTNIQIYSGRTDMQVDASEVVAGKSSLTFGKGSNGVPGAGNTAAINTTIDVPAWLEFNWSGSGSYNVNPSATATYGRFRGHDRVIFWLEQ